MSREFDKQISARRELMELGVSFQAREEAKQDSSKKRNRKLLAGSAFAFVCGLTIIQHDEVADGYEYLVNGAVAPLHQATENVYGDILHVKKLSATDETTDIASDSMSSDNFALGTTGFMAIYSLSALAEAGFAQYRRRGSQKLMQSQAKLGSMLAEVGQIPQPDWVTKELEATDL